MPGISTHSIAQAHATAYLSFEAYPVADYWLHCYRIRFNGLLVGALWKWTEKGWFYRPAASWRGLPFLVYFPGGLAQARRYIEDHADEFLTDRHTNWRGWYESHG